MEEAPKMPEANQEDEVKSRVGNPETGEKNVLLDSEEEIAAAMEKADSFELETSEQEEARLAGVDEDSLDKAA